MGKKWTDKLAKLVGTINVFLELKVDKNEFVPYYKHNIIKEFHGEQKNKTNIKGSAYKLSFTPVKNHRQSILYLWGRGRYESHNV